MPKESDIIMSMHLSACHTTCN